MKRKGFTLVELLIVISIIAIIAGLSMAALLGASEEGRRTRARSQIAKLDQLISEKWNSYRFRQLPFRVPSVSYVEIVNGKPVTYVYTTAPTYAARMRLDVMRELQRLEMPDRLTDILDNPVAPSSPAIQDPFYISKGGLPPAPQPLPAATRAYRRKVTPQAAGSLQYDQAEMLYLIISEIRDGDKSALQYFSNSEIGDLDGDGMNELLDPWGQPIMFLRWAPGYSSMTAADLGGALSPPAPQPTVAVSTFQLPDGTKKADAFDPLKADPRWTNNLGFKPFQIRPLIFSGGPDKVYDIYTDDGDPTQKIRYSQTNPANDPYLVKIIVGQPMWVGMPSDYDSDGLQNGDNITNHGMEIEGE